MKLGVGPATPEHEPIANTPEHERIAKMHNHASVEMARQWVVAASRAELEAVRAELTPEKMLTRRRTDRVIVSHVNR